jgi:hypothetical protein
MYTYRERHYELEPAVSWQIWRSRLSHNGVLCVNGRETLCLILMETPKWFPIRLMQDCALPGRNQKGPKGEEIYVSKEAIKREALHQYYQPGIKAPAQETD